MCGKKFVIFVLVSLLALSSAWAFPRTSNDSQNQIQAVQSSEKTPISPSYLIQTESAVSSTGKNDGVTLSSAEVAEINLLLDEVDEKALALDDYATAEETAASKVKNVRWLLTLDGAIGFSDAGVSIAPGLSFGVVVKNHVIVKGGVNYEFYPWDMSKFYGSKVGVNVSVGWLF